MSNIKTLSKVGIGLALLDFVIRGFGPLYTTAAQSALNVGHFIGIGIIPLLAILASVGFIKGKKWGLYLGIVLMLLSLVGVAAIFRGNDFNILALLYLVVYGILVFLSFKSSSNLK